MTFDPRRFDAEGNVQLGIARKRPHGGRDRALEIVGRVARLIHALVAPLLRRRLREVIAETALKIFSNQGPLDLVAFIQEGQSEGE